MLKHILRLIIEPETQPPSIRRLGHISVAMLETAAMESLSIWFQDANKPKNAKKRPILKELFKVARMEEKFKRNEIGWWLNGRALGRVSVRADRSLQMPIPRSTSRRTT